MPVPPSYDAARRAAALIDLSARGRIAVGGDDRASYLQGLLTNDIPALSPGDGCYAAYLTPQGRMIADLQVLNLGAELLLDVHPTVSGMLLDRLRDFIFTEDVTVEDRSASWIALGVHGPGSGRLVSEVVQVVGDDEAVRAGADTRDGAPEYRNRWGRFEGVPVVTARSDETGELGFVLYTEAGIKAALAGALVQAGAAELDQPTFDLLRIEAGRPAFPTDMDQETIPLEAGIEDRAISMTKGCYVGQEVIVRILHRGKGRVGRRLVGLSFDTEGEPPAAAAVLTSPADGDPVGRVTSSAWSPSLGRAIALGYVKRELAEPGTALVAMDGARQMPGVVTARPFVPLRTAG